MTATAPDPTPPLQEGTTTRSSRLTAARARMTSLAGGMSPWALLPGGYLLLLILLAVAAPVLPLNPTAQDLSLRLTPPFTAGLDDWQMFLGGDALGRSVAARLLYGARVSLFVGLSSAAIAMAIGVPVGIVAGVVRGRVEDLIMRVADMWMSMPTILMALVVLFTLGAGVRNLIFVLAIMRWMVFARVARALTLSIRENQYYEAARAVGCSTPRIMRKHVLPNLKWDMLSLWTLEAARAMLAEAALSFLGVGIQPPQSSWGTMLADARVYMSSSPWLILMPGLLIMLTTISVNLLINARREGGAAEVSFWGGRNK